MKLLKENFEEYKKHRTEQENEISKICKILPNRLDKLDILTDWQ